MARPIRIQYPGAVYHVMARGNHGQKIFADDADRKTFLSALAEACAKTGWRIHAYVLMANHYHLLLQTPEPNLVDGMKWLQGVYTLRHNSRHKVRGHLFQGRYKAIPVETADGTGDYFGVVVEATHHGIVALGHRAVADGPLQQGQSGREPDAEQTIPQAEKTAGSTEPGKRMTRSRQPKCHNSRTDPFTP